MRDKIKNAEAQLQEFEKTRGAEHLENAVQELEAVDLLSVKPTSERLAARRELISGWCRALSAIDTILDPSFDPDDLPQSRVAPPLAYANAAHASGEYETSINHDPALRARYEAAVAANERKKAERRVQWLARELDDQAVESAQRLIAKIYTTSAADRKELEAAFDKTSLSPARRAQILLVS